MDAIESNRNDLQSIFNPKSVAVIGASKQQTKWGYRLLHDIIDGGFKGEIYPINPKEGEILGRKAYPNIRDVERPVDLAIIGIPASAVPAVVNDCAAKGVKGLVIVTAGFSETGEEGKKLEQEISQSVRASGMRLVGPNCLGIMNSSANLNASLLAFTKGGVAFICQSGNLCDDVQVLLQERGWGFSKLISMGNQTDILFHEYLKYVKDEADTQVVLLHIEEVKDGKRFLEAVRETVKKKPVVALKVGETKAGERAVKSHTGALAGRFAVYDAAFRQSGIIRASDCSDLVDFGDALVKLPPIKRNRVVVLTDGGGHGAMACDAAEKFGLEVPILSSETQNKLRAALLPQSGTVNPVDFAGAAENDLWSYTRATEIILQDDEVDGLLIIGALFGIYSAHWGPELKRLEIDVTRRLCELVAKYKKPIIMHCLLPVREVTALKTLRSGGIPVYTRVETAVRCMVALADYGSYLEKIKTEGVEPPSLISRKPKVEQIIERAKAMGRSSLLETEAKEILKEYRIPVPEFRLARSKQEATRLAEEVGYPVAAKVVSPQIIHKSDAGGVKLNLKAGDEVGGAFDDIIKSAKAYNKQAQIEGVLLSPMEKKGVEVIIGMTRDAQFGPVIMFGLGGIFVEVLKDVSFRIVPLTKGDAYEMVRQIKGYPILEGVRGEEASDIEAIVDIIMKVSTLAGENEAINELDLNPVFIFKDGASVVDVRMILSK